MGMRLNRNRKEKIATARMEPQNSQPHAFFRIFHFLELNQIHNFCIFNIFF